ncbi:MAG: flippase-like domain-containing protein [Methanolinea sp.]|nr:flippase-like domain-containing protein [Methanolinea sp.]
MNPNRLRRILQGFQFGLGIAIIIAILVFVSTNEFLATLLSIDVRFFILALVCYFLNNALMIFRLKSLLAHQGRRIRLKFVFLAHMSGMILSDFTPLRSGYLYTAEVLRKKGVPLEKGTAAITSTYMYDLVFKVSVAILGFSYLYTSLMSPEITYSLATILLLIATILALYFLILYPRPFIRRIMTKWAFGQKVLAMGEEARKIQPLFPMILIVSFFGWLLRGLQWVCIGLSLHMTFASYLDAFFLSPLLTLFSLIPLTPAGIGIQETAIIAFFSVIGISLTTAASFAFLVRGSEILVDSIGIRGFFINPKDEESLKAHYQSIPGDIDDQAYNSNLLVQRYFQRRKTETIKQILGKGNGVLLDIGCGSGVQIEEIQKDRPGMAIGIDINRNALCYARGKQIPGASFIQADVQYLPIRDCCVDRVISAEIVEHVSRPEGMLKEIRRVLAPGGEVVITTPNERSIWGIYEFFWDLFGRGRNYGETHLRFFSARELCGLFLDFSSCSTRTLFFISPLFALTNSPSLLSLGMRIDTFFENLGWGVSLILHARK